MTTPSSPSPRMDDQVSEPFQAGVIWGSPEKSGRPPEGWWCSWVGLRRVVCPWPPGPGLGSSLALAFSSWLVGGAWEPISKTWGTYIYPSPC